MEKNTNQKIKINYLALGDSFVAGYNSKIGFNTNGYMNDNGQIIGLGYPSSLACLIKQNPNYELNSFYNLGVVCGSIDFLTSLFSNNKKDLKQNNNKIDLLQSLDWYSPNPFKNHFSKYFNEWNINNNNFEIYSKKIKEANLITLTAGLYDFLALLPYHEFTLLHKLTGDTRDAKLEEIQKEISILAIKVESKLFNLISTIKNINSKAKIVLTNYAGLLIHLKEAINTFVNVTRLNKFNLYKYIENKLNNAIMNTAKKYSVEYINVNDEDFWDNNKFYLSENILSIYPTEKGYKKIGYDIYSKLLLNKKTFEDDLNVNSFEKKYILNKDYWLSNFDKYSSLKNDQENLELFKNTYGKNKNEHIYIYNKREQNNSNYLDSKINFSNFSSLFIRYSKAPISATLKRIILEKFAFAEKKYEIVNKIIDFLNNEKRSKEFALTLLKDGKIDNILFILEKELSKKSILESRGITFSDMKKEFNNIIVNQQNMVYDVLKYFFSSGLINESREEIKEIFEVGIKESLNTDLLSYLFNFKNNKKFQKVREYLSSLSSFKEFVDFLVESLINYSDIYVKLNTFDEFWSSFIIKNKYNLLFLFDKMFLEISDENKFDNTVDFVVQTIQSSIRLQRFDAKDYKNLKNSIISIFNIIKNNPKYLNNIFLRILDKIKSISLYGLVFKNKKNLQKQRKMKWIKIISLNNFFIVGLKVAKHLLTIQSIISKNKLE
ncbi:SGNH/GDSL hydrolase family protein [Metamycoplasma phocicerebrale]|uniref:SGNH/GDSL hydrolase family protein n=1 Tax=Metamycoplasma phocicerebrale TaxID=142649 RepID=A0A3Q9V9H4_9BACT|nr:SGNH/GDSL hydrolase family protein [Metamycoplasma phocicerebrale]AZZ65539.1 SGNH/GDSL hydrolase family protein [Metamycoplasma phocicerebrale]